MATIKLTTPKTRLQKRSSSEEVRDYVEEHKAEPEVVLTVGMGDKLTRNLVDEIERGSFDLVALSELCVSKTTEGADLKEPEIVPFSCSLTHKFSTNCTSKLKEGTDKQGGAESGSRSNGFSSEVVEPHRKLKAAANKPFRQKQDRKPWTKAEEHTLSLVALEMPTNCDLKDLCKEAKKRGVDRPLRGIEKKFKRIYGETKWCWKKHKANFIQNAASKLQIQANNNPAQHLKRSCEQAVNSFTGCSPTKRRRYAA